MDWDTIVIGTGGAGSAALDHLARRGARVLGIEQHTPGHDRGSSHGGTRAIRLAYFEHPAYVPLLRRAYTLWAELEAATGQHLYTPAGVLQIGAPGGEVVSGVLRSARTHGLDVSVLSPEALAERFSGFRVPVGMVALFEAQAGYLCVEDAVRAHAARAVASGAVLWEDTRAAWRAIDGGVAVQTHRGETTARHLVLTTGAWSGLPGLSVVRKTLHWLDPRTPDAYLDGPVYLYELPTGIFYGFPQRGGHIKIAEHTGGDTVSGPASLDRRATAQDRAPVQQFARQWMPGVEASACVQDAVCMYTVSPDGHFVIGSHPLHPQVSVVAGLSGHGFKFAPVLGEILADLAERGETAHPIAPFSPGRLPRP